MSNKEPEKDLENFEYERFRMCLILMWRKEVFRELKLIHQLKHFCIK